MVHKWNSMVHNWNGTQMECYTNGMEWYTNGMVPTPKGQNIENGKAAKWCMV